MFQNYMLSPPSCIKNNLNDVWQLTIIKISNQFVDKISWITIIQQRSLTFDLGKMYIFFYFTNHHPHHHVVPPARISLTLSRHSSQSFIASGRSSGLHPISLHSCCMYVRAGRPAFARPYVGVHRSTSLMSSSLLLQQYPACLVRLTWIVFVMAGRWPYSWCLVGCCRQDLFNFYSQHSCIIAV